MRYSSALLLSTLSIFTLSSPANAGPDGRAYEGEWVLDLARSLRDANYKEGHRYFQLKDMHLSVAPGGAHVDIRGATPHLAPETFRATLKRDKLVVWLKPKQAFNYKDHKILLTIVKQHLKARYRPEKGAKALELYFTRRGQGFKPKPLSVKRGATYLSQTPIDGARWEMTFEGGRVKLGPAGATEDLDYVGVWRRKAFVDGGRYMIKAASKMLYLYSRKHADKFVFVPRD